MSKKEASINLLPYPLMSTIYATNCIPLAFSISFPPDFTDSDKNDIYQSLRKTYEEYINRN